MSHRNYRRSGRVGKYPAGEDDREEWETSRTWIYFNEHGVRHAKVVRRENALTGEKSYPTFHWEEMVIGSAASCEWVAGWPERRLPYRLPELIASMPSETVYICEGEKCADALAFFRFTATCNLGGARKWHDDCTEFFKGKQRVVICEDNDTDGRRHAEKVVRALRDIVPDIAILSFREMDEGEDVADWLKEQRNSRKAFLLKVEEAIPVRELPEVCITVKGEVAAAEETVELMNESLPLYMRAGFVVEPISRIETVTYRGKALRVRQTFMRKVDPPMLSYFLRKHVARFTGFVEQE